MLSELKNAVNDVFSNKIRVLIVWSVLSAILVFALLFAGFAYAMSFFELTLWPNVQKTVEFLGYVLFFVMSLMLFPCVVTFVSGFFIDSVTDRLAAKNGIHTLRNVPLSESLAESGIIAVKGALVSGTLIPVTLILGLIPGANFIPVVLYYVMNGRLLGREYFFAVALRYMEKQKAEELFNRYRSYWSKAGIIIAVIMTVPLINAVAPLIAMAFMQRLFMEKNPNRETV